MMKYLLRRILVFIPTLIIISLLAFLLISNAPGDPVSKLMNEPEQASAGTGKSQKELLKKKLGLNLPLFFFSITNLATPDTLYKIDQQISGTTRHLIYSYGNWNQISVFQNQIQVAIDNLQKFKAENDSLPEKQSAVLNLINEKLSALQFQWSENEMKQSIALISQLSNSFSVFSKAIQLQSEKIKSAFNEMVVHQSRWKCFVPCIHFYLQNQYARWLFGDGNWITGNRSVYTKGIVRGDFGISFNTQMPVIDELKHRLPWSLFFTFISILLAYLISIPMGIKAASHKGKFFDRSSTIIVFILYSMPAFWLATLLLMTFANPDVIGILPASGVGPIGGIDPDTSWVQWLMKTIPYLILPTIAYTYSSFAFISRIVKVSMLEVLNQDYIRTARAKGLTQYMVIYRHAFRNSLLPLITMFANVFPAAIGGSVILETIFSIPGMGQEIYQAIFNQDYPVVIAVFTITGVLTLFAYLLADIFYSIADPRISFSKKK